MPQVIRENVPIAPLTYYKIGGPARYFAQPQNIEELNEIREFICNQKVRYFVLGAGSNVLIDDAGFDGLIISTAKLDRTLEAKDNTITVGTSVMVIQLLRHCMSEGVAGFELLVGIPGNMGGVFYMNAGTKLGEIKDVVQDVTAYDLATGATRVIERSDLKYSYRKQHFLKKHELVLRGTVRGKKSEPKAVQDQVQALLASRKASQPIDKPSCGSVFKNPDPAKGLHAWKVIADCGLRGHRAGNAQISELHTNFIVNLGGATAGDVLTLITEAKARAHAKFGVTLEEEVQIVARDSGKIL